MPGGESHRVFFDVYSILPFGMNHPEAITHLHRFVDAIHPLAPEEWGRFSAIWQSGEAKRKTILTAKGDTERTLYFITEGVQRAYYLTKEDKEATILFTYPFSFSGVADSFLTQTPSLYFLETLTQSEFLKTTYAQVNALCLEFPNFARMLSTATAYALKGALQRQIELQTFSAEEKFTTLLKRSPQVLRLIPHKYLASYLGIDAATFSKLLATVRV
ncbi:MAG: Crp/Fnr family transcriptional regulator [Cyclobacteriaceae bacterium]|jgi:CRP-like cAMP-binding protein|nr:Crp/Fnr family transcriptional regulator [Flammeovirgaceae bacterium]